MMSRFDIDLLSRKKIYDKRMSVRGGKKRRRANDTLLNPLVESLVSHYAFWGCIHVHVHGHSMYGRIGCFV